MRTSPRRPNDSKTGAESETTTVPTDVSSNAAVRSSPRRPNDDKTGTQSESTTVLTDVSSKESTYPSCDWAIEGRCIPGLNPVKCQYSRGCTKFVHHVCTIEWARENNIDEGGIALMCRDHHPEYIHYSKPSSPKESTTTSSPSHNLQTGDGNNDSNYIASNAVSFEGSGTNSPENIDKSWEGYVHDVSPIVDGIQVAKTVDQNHMEGIGNENVEDAVTGNQDHHDCLLRIAVKGAGHLQANRSLTIIMSPVPGKRDPLFHHNTYENGQ